MTLALSAYASVTDAVIDVQARMEGGVQDGSFNRYLTRYAAALQSPDMLSVTSSSVQVIAVDTSDSTDTPSDDTASSSNQDLIGALCGFLVVLGVMGIIVCYVSWRKSKDRVRMRGSSYAEVALGSDSTHSSYNPTHREKDVEMEIELSTSIVLPQPQAERPVRVDRDAAAPTGLLVTSSVV